MGKETKTNAVRILERNKVPYELITYECDEFIDGMHTVEKTGAPVEQTYKTLVMQGKSKQYYVFVLPIAEEVDLKAAARSVGEKSVEMIHVKVRYDVCQRRTHWNHHQTQSAGSRESGSRYVCTDSDARLIVYNTYVISLKKHIFHHDGLETIPTFVQVFLRVNLGLDFRQTTTIRFHCAISVPNETPRQSQKRPERK